MKIFLIGFMGAGKSTVGRSVAKRMQLSFIDLDRAVESAEGLTIPQIFSLHGQSYFRAAESRVLREISLQDDVVIATGGGTPCFDDNMTYMKENGITVYLKLEAKVLMSRLQNAKTNRPLIQDKTSDELLQYIIDTLSQREVIYNTSQVIIDNTTRDTSILENVLSYYKKK